MSVSVINQSTRAYTIAKAANITENDLNTRDSNGRTVLFYAARYGKAQAVKNLLNAGSDPNIHDVEESTPLHEAVERCHTEVVKILVKNANTDINAKNKLGQTPLIKAVVFDDVEALKMLHKAGASLEEPDSAGKTPFLVAMEEGRERCADYLLKNNCNVDTMDKLGQTALYLGVICFHGSASENVRKLLKSGYNLEKDRKWLTKAGVDIDAFKQKNFFQRLITRITTTQARRHSEGQILARYRTKSESARVVSHAHPRFRAKSKSFQL